MLLLVLLSFLWDLSANAVAEMVKNCELRRFSLSVISDRETVNHAAIPTRYCECIRSRPERSIICNVDRVAHSRFPGSLRNKTCNSVDGQEWFSTMLLSRCCAKASA